MVVRKYRLFLLLSLNKTENRQHMVRQTWWEWPSESNTEIILVVVESQWVHIFRAKSKWPKPWLCLWMAYIEVNNINKWTNTLKADSKLVTCENKVCWYHLSISVSAEEWWSCQLAKTPDMIWLNRKNKNPAHFILSYSWTDSIRTILPESIFRKPYGEIHS